MTHAKHTKIAKKGKSMPAKKAPSPQAKLTEQFVAYIDLLGFREAMRIAAEDPNKSDALLADFQSAVVQTVREILVPTEDWHRWTYRGFTDNFVIAIPTKRYADDDGESVLGMLLLRIAEFQLKLALKGWFVRGGLAMGNFFMDDLSVFGPALIDAYLLESEYARDPRIVLSKSVSALVKNHMRFYGSGYDSPQNRTILLDVDGYPFINYLYEIIDGRDDEDDYGIAHLKQHKSRVEEKLNQFQNNPTIWAKYRWVASYHDFFCSTWLKSERRKELRISTKALAATPRLLIKKP